MVESKEADNRGQPDVSSTGTRGHARVHLPTGRIVLNNFLGGLAWGVGTVLGATVIVALIILLLTKLSAIPVIGNFFINILNQIKHSTVQ